MNDTNNTTDTVTASSANLTSLLEAAEEFIDTMDDAFAQLDMDSNDDNNLIEEEEEEDDDNDEVREDVEEFLYPDLNQFDYSDSFHHGRNNSLYNEQQQEQQQQQQQQQHQQQKQHQQRQKVDWSKKVKEEEDAEEMVVNNNMKSNNDTVNEIMNFNHSTHQEYYNDNNEIYLNNIHHNEDDEEGEDYDDDATKSTLQCISSSSSSSPLQEHEEDEEEEEREEDATTLDSLMNTRNKIVLDIVQEEPEEIDQEDIVDGGKGNNNGKTQSTNNITHWDDENGFFDFTDEEDEDNNGKRGENEDASFTDSPLLSPMTVVPAKSTTATKAPQDQPELQLEDQRSHDDELLTFNDEEGEEEDNDAELNTSESMEITNILHCSSIDTIQCSNQSATKMKTSHFHNNSIININNNHNNNKDDMISSPPPSSCAKTLTYTPSSSLSSSYNNHNQQQQSKTDQLAQSHAEDVLSLTLEIQNLRSQLHQEQQEHIKTKLYLEKEESKSVQTEIELQRYREEIYSLKKEYEENLCLVQEEREMFRNKMEAAEEDAQQALVIARDSDMKVGEMEDFLLKALDEVEQLRASSTTTTAVIPTTTAAAPIGTNSLPMISEQEYCNNDNDNDQSSINNTIISEVDHISLNYETPQRSIRGKLPSSVSSYSPYRRDRAGITVARNLLRQAADLDDMSNLSLRSKPSDEEDSTITSSYRISLTRRSAEKRQKLKQCIDRANNVDPTGKEVVCISSPYNNGLDLGCYGSPSLISIVKTVSKIMKQSGKRLNLGGRYFNGPNSSAIKKKNRSASDCVGDDSAELEVLTRNYCRSVESLVSKQKDEVKELKQFCGFLEEKLK